MKRMAFILPLAVLLGLVALLGYGLTRHPHVLPSALVGHQAPELNLPALKRKHHNITLEAARGRVVLVNVWASWCVACRGEVPILAEISRRTGAPIIGMAYKDERDAARKWLAHFGNPFAVVALDASGHSGINWGISGVPETFVIDASGKVRYKVMGPLDKQQMQQNLVPLINRLQAAS
jgi:cytochrome c biogenesis protein CcmG/thiol:disulfide interchange protein DsbE